MRYEIMSDSNSQLNIRLQLFHCRTTTRNCCKPNSKLITIMWEMTVNMSYDLSV